MTIYVIARSSYDLEKIFERVGNKLQYSTFDLFTNINTNVKSPKMPIYDVDPILIYPMNRVFIYEEDEGDFREIAFIDINTYDDDFNLPFVIDVDEFNKFLEYYIYMNRDGGLMKGEDEEIRREARKIIQEHYVKEKDGVYIIDTKKDHSAIRTKEWLVLYRLMKTFRDFVLEPRKDMTIFSLDEGKPLTFLTDYVHYKFRRTVRL